MQGDVYDIHKKKRILGHNFEYEKGREMPSTYPTIVRCENWQIFFHWCRGVTAVIRKK